MKNKTWNCSLLIMGVLLMLTTSCKKEETKTDPPPVTTNTVKDVEGNEYHTVTIGTQVWMIENLRTTKYNDGTSIPKVTDTIEWAALTTAAYCWNNNEDLTYKPLYGALYNWYSVNTGKLCPKGWHVPSEAEWINLITYLGGEKLAYSNLKDTGTIYWHSPNVDANNSSGFTAIPGGGRYKDGTFFLQDFSCWWSSTETNAATAPFFYLHFDIPFVMSYSFDKKFGFSVRCIKD